MRLFFVYMISAICLSWWGIVLSSQPLTDTTNLWCLHSASVIIFVYFVFMWIYSIYHRIRYHRACCWHCFTLEHDTCLASYESRVATEEWRSTQRKNKKHVDKPPTEHCDSCTCKDD